MRRVIVVSLIAATSVFFTAPVLAKSVTYRDAMDTLEPDADLSDVGYVTHLRDDGARQARFWVETYGGKVRVSFLAIAVDSTGGPGADHFIGCNFPASPAICTIDELPIGVGWRWTGRTERMFVYMPKWMLHPARAIRWRITSDNGSDDSSDAAPGWTGWYQS